MKSFGEAFRFARSSIKDLTQEDVAKRVGIAQTHLSKYERGVVSPSWEQATRLVYGVGMTMTKFCKILEMCESDDISDDVFSVDFFDAAKRTKEDIKPIKSILVWEHGIWTELLNLPASAGRFILVRATLNIMEPIIDAGDLMIIDQKMRDPIDGRIVAGWGRHDHPEMMRVKRDGRDLFLEPYNLRYSKIPVSEFEIHGTVRATIRQFI